MRPRAYPRAFLIGMLLGSHLDHWLSASADSGARAAVFVLRIIAIACVAITMWLDGRDDKREDLKRSRDK